MPKTSTCERPSSHEVTLKSTADTALSILKEEPYSKFAIVASEAATVIAKRTSSGIETRILRVRPVGTKASK